MNGVLICSVSPEEYLIKRNSYIYTITIPACKANQSYTSFRVTDQTDNRRVYNDLTHIDVIPHHIAAKDIVADVFKTEELESKGCFVPAGEIPTEHELGAARLKRQNTLTRWINEGDIAFSKYGTRGIQAIPDYCKRAVVELGEQRDWVFNGAVSRTECEGCGEMVKNLTTGKPPAVCPRCHAILDPEKAIRLGLAETQEPPKRRPGRPKRDKAEPVTVA